MINTIYLTVFHKDFFDSRVLEEETAGMNFFLLEKSI